jgi:hypothetical protein
MNHSLSSKKEFLEVMKLKKIINIFCLNVKKENLYRVITKKI